MYSSVRKLIATVAAGIFSISLFDAIFSLRNIIVPGVSNIYNQLGVLTAPNMVTVVIFDWRGYDTLGEALILLSAVLVVLLVFGKGRLGGNNQ